MNTKNMEIQQFLRELYQKTQGDLTVQVSMFEVGAALNLEKGKAGKIAEDLIGNGLAEVKTLSGGIGITTEGIEEVRKDGDADGVPSGLDLNTDPVLNEASKETLAQVIKAVQEQIYKNSFDFKRIEEMVIDLKTIEVQLLSPKPKTAIIREALRSLHAALVSTKETGITDRLEKIIGP